MMSGGARALPSGPTWPRPSRSSKVTQPHLPADLGFYDLRVPEVREQQAELAREAGIEGFCYWHYWFAGKQLLERPFNEVLASGKPDFPFCLAWANQSWKGVWHGSPGRILIEQTYPGAEDFTTHFWEVQKAFKDPRYIHIEGKPLFVVYKPAELPDAQMFISTWQTLAREAGFSGIFMMAMGKPGSDFRHLGFDGLIVNNFQFSLSTLESLRRSKWISRVSQMVLHKDIPALIRNMQHRNRVYSYSEFVEVGLAQLDLTRNEFPEVYPGWDNSPRSKNYGFILEGSSPELFKSQLCEAISQVEDYPPGKQIVFIKSWNEWAEGNYLEPDQRYGNKYLDAIKELLNDSQG